MSVRILIILQSFNMSLSVLSLNSTALFGFCSLATLIYLIFLSLFALLLLPNILSTLFRFLPIDLIVLKLASVYTLIRASFSPASCSFQMRSIALCSFKNYYVDFQLVSALVIVLATAYRPLARYSSLSSSFSLSLRFSKAAIVSLAFFFSAASDSKNRLADLDFQNLLIESVILKP